MIDGLVMGLENTKCGGPTCFSFKLLLHGHSKTNYSIESFPLTDQLVNLNMGHVFSLSLQLLLLIISPGTEAFLAEVPVRCFVERLSLYLHQGHPSEW